MLIRESSFIYYNRIQVRRNKQREKIVLFKHQRESKMTSAWAAEPDRAYVNMVHVYFNAHDEQFIILRPYQTLLNSPFNKQECIPTREMNLKGKIQIREGIFKYRDSRIKYEFLIQLVTWTKSLLQRLVEYIIQAVIRCTLSKVLISDGINKPKDGLLFKMRLLSIRKRGRRQKANSNDALDRLLPR